MWKRQKQKQVPVFLIEQFGGWWCLSWGGAGLEKGDQFCFVYAEFACGIN